MTETRDISTPTCISLCMSGKYLMIKDLSGKSHIFSQSEKETIADKVIELASDKTLPFVDVGKVSLTDEQSTSSFDESLDLEDLNPDNIKKIILQQGLGFLKGFTSYPRGKSTPRKKSGK